MIDLTTFLAAVVPVSIGGIAWGTSISTRLAVNEKAVTATKELTLSKLDEISRRLGRIETAMNGSLRRIQHDDYEDES